MIVTFEDYLVRDFPTKENGNKAVGVPIWVYVHGTNELAELYSKDSSRTPNPVITDERGNYSFKVEEGFYDFKVNVNTDAEAFLYEDKVVFGESVFIDAFEAYEVPPFNGNQFELPRKAEHIFVTINGRGIAPSGVTIDTDKVTITLVDYAVTVGDTVVVRAAFVDEETSEGGDGGGVNTIGALVNLGDSFYDGFQVSVASYHNTFGGGAGVYVWSESQLKAAHNGGTIIDPTASFPADWNDDAEREAWYNANNAGTGCWVRIKEKSVNVKWFGAKGDGASDDYHPLKACFDASESDIIMPRGSYLTTESLYIPVGRDLIGEGQHNETRIIGDINGGLIENSTGQWWKNTFKNISFQNQYNSTDAACIRGTMYQCEIERCGFTVMYGKGVELLSNDYAVENYIARNYFNGCKYGIYAGTSSTDNFIIDNYFWRGSGSRETAIVNSIYCVTPSGSTFRGNHFYGGSDDAMMRLIGGDNVSVLDNYFEGSDNPRLKIQGGNPSTFTITGNKFWMGDGNETDSLGDKSSIISLRFNLYNPCSISFSGNIFSGGVNEVSIFSMRNGDDGVSNIKISFDKSNVIRGSYSLADLAASGDADVPVLGRIDSNHSEFVYESTAQNESPTSLACSEFHQYDTGNAETFPVLASNTASVSWKPKVIHNLATTTEVSLSSGATIENNRRIKPGEIAIIRAVDSSTYRIEFLKEKGLTITSYPLTAVDFGAGSSIPAGGQVESNIEPLGYPLTNPETILTCYPKSLAAGLVATVYYNQSAFNNWVLRLTNTTGSAITNTTSTAIVNIFEEEA